MWPKPDPKYRIVERPEGDIRAIVAWSKEFGRQTFRRMPIRAEVERRCEICNRIINAENMPAVGSRSAAFLPMHGTAPNWNHAICVGCAENAPLEAEPEAPAE